MRKQLRFVINWLLNIKENYLEPNSWILYCTAHIKIIWLPPTLFLHDPYSPNILLVSWRSSSPMLKSSGAYQREQQSWRPWECCHEEKSFFNSEVLQPPLGCQLKSIQWPIIIQIEHFMTCGVQAVSRVGLYTFSCDVRKWHNMTRCLLNVRQHQKRLIPTILNRLRKSLSRWEQCSFLLW